MKSAARGKSISSVEVTNISAHGLWLFLDSKEHFLPYDEFPWFKNAKVAEILNVERPQSDHLYWPDLDVDLHAESIEHPEHFPLKAKVTR